MRKSRFRVLRAFPAAVALPLLVASCQPATASRPSPAASAAAVADHNSHLGNSRAAAELGAAVGRYLYQSVSYWEVAVVTSPAAGRADDPFDLASLQRSGAEVRQVRIVMATEAAGGIARFRAGGHAHEQQVTEAVARLAATYFTQATTYEVDVYYGEDDLHATGTLTGGAYTYLVHDGQ